MILLETFQKIAIAPLHELTEVYGLPGLMGRFFLEINDFTSAERDSLQDAFWLAFELHKEDRRQRETYISHPLRVMLRIKVHYHLNDVEVLIAALLHDCVEDHRNELVGQSDATREQAVDVLASRYGDRVAGLVGAVTNPEFLLAKGDSKEQYRAHVRELLKKGDVMAGVIKLSDFTDNGVGLGHTAGGLAVRLAKKYLALPPAFEVFLERPDLPFTAEVVVHAREQIVLGKKRLALLAEMP